MIINSKADNLEQKQICSKCVREKYLSEEIKEKGVKENCSYCNEQSKCYSLEELSERIDMVFNQHFVITSDQPDSWQYSLLADKESDYSWERDGEPVIDAIMNAADIPENAAKDIQIILDDRYSDFEAIKAGEETPYSSESYYEDKGVDDYYWREEWNNFERSLKTEARYFSRSAVVHLKSVFDNVDKMLTIDGRRLVVDAGPGTDIPSLFRARVFQSDEKLAEALKRPDKNLGSPPSQLASAGRMNARGISVFYAANDPKVAIAEVRPPVGSQVAVAKFEIIRPVRLLDLTAVSAVRTIGSIFDSTLAGRLERAMFLRSLSKRMTRPVMPDDEVFEYLPTQAVADFLATESSMKIDGIIYPSVQAEGEALNIMLFHKAAMVAELDIPKGTEISAHLGESYEEGWEADYSVIEEIPANMDKPAIENSWPSITATLHEIDTAIASGHWDSREATLNVCADSIAVHIVRAVGFKTNEHKVRRQRWEKRSSDF